MRIAGREFFHGWVVVGGAFLTMFLGFGIVYSFAAFIAALEAEFGASRTAVSLVYAVASALYFSLGALSGVVADRVGPRSMTGGGLLVIALGLFLASTGDSLLLVGAAFALATGLGVGMGYVPSIGAVQHWFIRKRGMASGLAVSGIGVGMLLMPPLAAGLIALFDWRVAMVCLGALALLGALAATLMVESSPQRRGLAPDGDPLPRGGPSGSAAVLPGVPWAEAVRTRPFRLLYLSSFLVALGLFIPFVHLIPYARDQGLSQGVAVLLLSLIGVGSTAGRFVLGAFADRIGRRRALIAMLAGLAVMMLVWAISTAFWPLAVFAVLYGMFYGGFVALIPALTMDYFGARSVSGLIGALYTSVAVGTFAGPTLAGLAYDLVSDYTLPIVVAAVANVAAALCLAVLQEPDAWQREQFRVSPNGIPDPAGE
ncbi:MAG: MFS transporter [Ectothiorhodospiraceae bacterium]|nr:MFS transporter [Ectothiorhodospiraceae bacterium]